MYYSFVKFSSIFFKFVPLGGGLHHRCPCAERYSFSHKSISCNDDAGGDSTEDDDEDEDTDDPRRPRFGVGYPPPPRPRPSDPMVTPPPLILDLTSERGEGS